MLIGETTLDAFATLGIAVNTKAGRAVRIARAPGQTTACVATGKAVSTIIIAGAAWSTATVIVAALISCARARLATRTTQAGHRITRASIVTVAVDATIVDTKTRFTSTLSTEQTLRAVGILRAAHGGATLIG